MQDVSIEQFSEELKDTLSGMGVELSKGTVQILTREFFRHVEDIIVNKKKTRFSMYNKDIANIYWGINKKELCQEFAEGIGMSVHGLIKVNKLSRSAKKFYKKRMLATMSEKEGL